MLVLKLFTLQFTIDTERINSQLSHGKFKRFNLFFLHVGIKTLHYCLKLTQRGSTVSVHEKTIASVCERWLPLHVKRQSPLHEKAITFAHWKAITSVDPGRLRNDAERINIQLSHGKFKRFNLFFLHLGIKTVYITVYNWHREDQQSLHVKRQLPLHVKRWSPLHMKRWSSMLILGVGELTINTERINSQLSHGKFKRFNLFFLHVGIKTVYITVYNWHREDQQSLHVKRQLPLHVKRWSPLHMKRWSSMLILHMGIALGDWQSTQRGSTVNFHMENSKDLTWFSCMLVLKLFTLLFTIDTERINSICMWKGDYLCMWKGWLPLHIKRQLPLHVKRWLPLLILGIDDQCREDKQSTFTWKIQKI